ncbi:uncharacterized protein BO95DRAFT_477674 [Aspergillus brunneoviolaceus CBS 621.78]|uniref:Uncharacterized protein n=1 Tax=Aspergillus brunneoviolaceus CBS 621.78 TaxID=1450534 RepID=A0ACD1FRY8_9EURO|nr:hypothetical protein BO95DRAFT_477674 [Aspergillus brunneoviolaceus CBS 621.78]RAH39763.1 hypothetical protein BO95DRAFT_477674 [Aspergillus brunneoviolaceus CBS 621.78]
MLNLAQLQSQTRELLAALKQLTEHCPSAVAGTTEGMIPGLSPWSTTGESGEATRARETVLKCLAKLQVSLAGPIDVLQHMASQTQLLACLQWLGEFQVPACIPLDGSASIKDVAELIGPELGHVAHSPLSAAFVTNPSYLDAAMFLARITTPAALNMPSITRQRTAGMCERVNQVEQNNNIINMVTSSTLDETALPRLERQWYAYLRFGTGNLCDTATDIISCLNSFQGTSATVVEVGARSLDRAMTLANRYPTLRFIIQIHLPSSASGSGKDEAKYDRTRAIRSHSQITVQYRTPGTPQQIQDAAVYIINFPLPFPGVSSCSISAQLETELRAHLQALRLSPAATLVLTAPALPERGARGTEVAVLTRIRDLSFLQLANDREPEISELINLLNGVGDSEGRFVVVKKVKSTANNGAIGLELKYQEYADRQ